MLPLACSHEEFDLIRTSPTHLGQQLMLGPLEIQVMEVVWSSGESSVRDVVEKLDSKLAYTTVMTTLDRLFKKGLLDRHKSERAFLYSPRLSSQDWERRRAARCHVAGRAGRENP
jgi:predicted transcriptional regulator